MLTAELRRRRELLLSVDPAGARTDHQVTLHLGDTLAPSTDGLVDDDVALLAVRLTPRPPA